MKASARSAGSAPGSALSPLGTLSHLGTRSALSPLGSPTRVIGIPRLGAEDLEILALLLGSDRKARCLIVKDPRPFPLLDASIAAFAASGKVLVLDRIVSDPRTADIGAMAAGARDFAPELVIGIGGGSALDSAKAVRALLANDGELDDYLGGSATRLLGAKGPPLALVPTTTGTGSEVTRFGVYTSASGRKYTLNSPMIQAEAAVLVDSLVADIPPELLASTAFDAVTHALETLWNRKATAVSDALATDALCDLLAAFRPAWEARKAGSPLGTADLLRAACAAGIAFNLTGTAAIHALSFVLSEEWHIPHGTACAFFTEEVLAINRGDDKVHAKLARAARLIGAEASWGEDEAVDFLAAELSSLKQLVGLPSTFADIGVQAASLPSARIAELFAKVQADPKLANNAVALESAAVLALVAAKRG